MSKLYDYFINIVYEIKVENIKFEELERIYRIKVFVFCWEEQKGGEFICLDKKI